jgi:D-alanyl-D-alanine carboxypeptidase (penicillin-binding protein 5/6)
MNKKTKKIIQISLISVAGAVFLSFFATVCVRAITLRKSPALNELEPAQKTFLNLALDAAYPERTKILHPLPYSAEKPELNIWAKSAIAVNVGNGCVLFEKNADQIIPPASITKLFVIYFIM